MKTNKKNKTNKSLCQRKQKLLRRFLAFSIVLAVAVVACEQYSDTETTEPDDTYYQSVYVSGSETSSTSSLLFKQLGKSVIHESTGEAFGWILGAIGLASDPGTETEKLLGEIVDELKEINQNLQTIIDELNQIEQALIQINCSETLSLLDDDVSHIRTLITNHYNQIVALAAKGLAVDSNTLDDFVDLVLNGDANNRGMEEILSKFETVLWNSVDGGIMTLCLNSHILTHPSTGSFNDNQYYDQIATITDYYYGYYVNALLLFTEANNYRAWSKANDLGLVSDTYNTTNMPTICNIQQADIQLLCITNVTQVNNTYESLATIFTLGGAPYTGDLQITQHDPSNPTLWAKSVELFDEHTGAGRPDARYVWTAPYVDKKVGRCMGLYYNGLNKTDYNYTSGWEFANLADFQKFIPSKEVDKYHNIGKYLEAHGFENLVGTEKIFQVQQPIEVTLLHGGRTLEVIPFFFIDWGSSTNYDGERFTVFDDSKDFTLLMKPYTHKTEYVASCMEYTCAERHYRFESQDWDREYPTKLSFVNWNWLFGRGMSVVCGCGEIFHQKFVWADADFNAKNDSFHDIPGWFKPVQDDNRRNAYPFKWPLNRIKNISCTAGLDGRIRSKTNKGGMYTMCGNDFDIWLENKLPKPETYN